MNSWLRNTVLISSLTLQACNLAPKYSTPKMQNPDFLNEEKIDGKIKKQATEISWHNFFKNEELQKIIKLALENNKDLRISILNVMAAQEFYRIKKSDSFLSIASDLSFSRQRTPANSLIGFGGNFAANSSSFIFNNYRANLASASFELDLFSRLKNINEAAFEGFLEKIEDKKIAQISLISQVANSYLQWICDLEKLKIAKRSLKIEKKRFDLIKQSYESGILSKIDLQKAENDLSLIESEFAKINESAKKDENMLVLLTAQKNGKKLRKIALKNFSLTKNLDHKINAMNLLFRPDIQKAESKLRAQNANIGVARAAFFPSFSITGSYGFASTKFSNLLSSNSRGAWNFSPGISVPIFEGGKNLANLRTAKIEKRIAVENYQKTIKTAFKEVFDELEAKKSLKTQLNSAQKIAKSNFEIYKINQELQKIGSKNMIDLINDEQQLLVAQSSEIEAKRQYFVNQINLYKVFGGGV